MQGGDLDAALALTQQLAPGLLAANPRIHFRLQCQKFAELVRQAGGQAGGLAGGRAGGQAAAAAGAAGTACRGSNSSPFPQRFSSLWGLTVCLPPCLFASPHPSSLPFYSAQIKAGQVAEAVEYGRTHVVPLAAAAPSSGSGSSASSAAAAAAADRELLEDATALLAYDDPTTGPTGGLARLLAGWMLVGVAAWRPVQLER